MAQFQIFEFGAKKCHVKAVDALNTKMYLDSKLVKYFSRYDVLKIRDFDVFQLFVNLLQFFLVLNLITLLNLRVLMCVRYEKWIKNFNSEKRILRTLTLNLKHPMSVDEKTGKPKNGPFSSCPHLAYNLIHSFIFFLLALSTMRMKYLWTPHAAILASCVALPQIWGFLKWRDGRFFMSAALIGLCLFNTYEDYSTRIV